MLYKSGKEIIARHAVPEDIPSIRRILLSNLKQNLSEASRLQKGYVSLDIKESTLARIHDEIGITVAAAGREIIAYSVPIGLHHRAEILAGKDPLMELISKAEFLGKPLFSYRFVNRQTCVDEPYKGIGVPAILHTHSVQMLMSAFELLVIGIDKKNSRSLHVFRDKLGFHEVNRDPSSDWACLVHDMRQIRQK